MKERHELEIMLGNMLADPVFFHVDQRLRAPNLFSIFAMQYQKSRYSSLLAYFLNPNENHGLEDNFLRMFLARALDAVPPEPDAPTETLSPIPYAKVNESILDWDRLDISPPSCGKPCVDEIRWERAGARSTSASGTSLTVLLCMSKSPDSKRRLARYHGSGMQSGRSIAGEYLLDLYRRGHRRIIRSPTRSAVVLKLGTFPQLKLAPRGNWISRHLGISNAEKAPGRRSPARSSEIPGTSRCAYPNCWNPSG
jgi:hypothetical protein